MNGKVKRRRWRKTSLRRLGLSVLITFLVGISLWLVLPVFTSTTPNTVGGGTELTVYPVDKAQRLEPLCSWLMVALLVLGLGGCGVVCYLTSERASQPRAR